MSISGGIFNRALQTIKDNRQRRVEGGVNAIPFPMRRLSGIIPGIQRKNKTLVSAATGVGKSKLTKILYVIEPFEFVRTHPEMNIKLDLFYFALEESSENFIHSVMVYKLFKDHQKVVPIKELKSILSPDDELIDLEIVQLVEDMRPWFEEFEACVRIIDNIRHPTGIFKEVEAFLLTVGEWSYKDKIFHTHDGDQVHSVKDVFTYAHPQHYVSVIIDHLSLLTPEKGYTLHTAMTRMSSDYGITLRDKYSCSIVYVQQQAFASEEKQYTMRGSLVESKLEPTLQTLGDNKLISRDVDEVIVMFAPDRYDIQNHRGYNVLLLQDNYRSLQVLKSRDGESNVRIGVFFDGRSNCFEEFPKASEMDPEKYEYYQNRAGRATEAQRSDTEQRTLNFN
jgi:hypothetical protein